MKTRLYVSIGHQGDQTYTTSTKGRGTPYLKPSTPLRRRQQVWVVSRTLTDQQGRDRSYVEYFRQRWHAEVWYWACGGPLPSQATLHRLAAVG